MKQKLYEELELRDDFMFGKVMSNKDLCRRTLEVLLDISIEDIEYPDIQKTLNITAQGKSVRLDLYVADEKKTIYNGEMQQSTGRQEDELPKRSRYYQGMIDLNLLEKGINYHDLNDCYVIFICTYDPFGLGRCRYTFQNTCLEEPKLRLRDRTTKVFFNARGKNTEDISPALKAFLEYVDTLQATDGFTKELEAEVERVKQNVEWRREYMKTILHDRELKEEGIRIGVERGLKQGLEQGLEQGNTERLRASVISMLDKGMKPEEVAFYLELSIQEVERIRSGVAR